MAQGYALTNNVAISAAPDIAVEIAADFADAIVQQSITWCMYSVRGSDNWISCIMNSAILAFSDVITRTLDPAGISVD